MRHLYLLFGLFLAISVQSYGQTDSCWTVLLLKKGSKLEVKENMRSFSTTGFYLYRNCIYNIKTKRGFSYGGRLLNIKLDTLYFSTFFNENAAFKANQKLDTIALHYKQLDQLMLIADRGNGWYHKYDFEKFDFIFKKDTLECSLTSKWLQIYTNDEKHYELVPHLTAQGMNLLYEENGRTYYFYGTGMIRPDYSKMDQTYDVKNVIWFTPCKVEKINGIALGVFSENVKNNPFNEKDSLKINGMNIEINPFSILTLMNPYFVGPYSDSIEFYNEYLKKEIETTVNGVNISLVNTINETEINGINVTGLITLVDEIDGLSLSGVSNFAYEFNGVSIAGFYNRATVANGLQVGLVNESTNLKGIQIGLWNINGKRSLPIINWQF